MVDFDAVLAEATKDMPAHDANYALWMGPRVSKWLVPPALGLLAYCVALLLERLLKRLIPAAKA